jgi:hypothetical protein
MIPDKIEINNESKTDIDDKNELTYNTAIDINMVENNIAIKLVGNG